MELTQFRIGKFIQLTPLNVFYDVFTVNASRRRFIYGRLSMDKGIPIVVHVCPLAMLWYKRNRIELTDQQLS